MSRRGFRFLPVLAGLLLGCVWTCAGFGEAHRPPGTGEAPADAPVLSDPYLALQQEARKIPVRDGDRLTIARAPFSFIFPLLHYDGARQVFHSVQIAGSEDRSFLELRIGLRVDEGDRGLVLFAPGTGMSCAADGKYPIFFLERNHAHHYVVFQPGNPEAQRAEPVRALGDRESEVRFDISHYKWNDRTFSAADLPLKELYFAILMDRNRNGVMDDGELFRFTIVFH